MTTFALVHGAWNGAWCWDRLTPELVQRGHRVVAVDLPCEDVFAGCADYARVVVDAIEGEGEVVVVGHSLAGLTIPLVAAARNVQQLVFLCAFVPEPGESFAPNFSEALVPGFPDGVVRDPEGRSSWPAEAARTGLYPECDDDTAAWAIPRLRRQAPVPNSEPCPLEAWPGVDSAYVLGSRDSAVNPDWSRRAARERLGVEPIELDAGHWPMLTCPAVLAETLVAA